MTRSRVLLFLLVFICFSCGDESIDSVGVSEEYTSFESDLESIRIDGDQEVFETTSPNFLLGGAIAKNTDYARSGSTCIRLDSIHKYGLNCRIDNVVEREFLEVAVWVHKKSSDATLQVKLTGEESSYRYRSIGDPNDLGENGWVRHSVAFTVGPGIERIDINVFSGAKVAYFDDFSFKRYKSTPENDLSTTLSLAIPDSSSDKLRDYIMNATNFETIPTSSKKYVPAEIIEAGDTANIQMKLKGDWTDHLYTGKESYRIKIKGNLAFQGLKSFSIQHPKTRRYLDEWVVHKIADREDILTTTYDFINVKMNTINFGIYALEEHFDKQLLESRNRREGPILKFDETSAWAVTKKFPEFDSMSIFPYFQESEISVFKQNRTRKSEQLSKQFREGKKLLYLFKQGHAQIEDLFDMDQMAKFYVLMELSGSAHGTRWHNRRFYFNPVTQKLEHIAYDILPFARGKNYECQIAQKLSQSSLIHEYCFDNAILYNEKFKERYLYYLDRMTQPTYLDSVFSELDEEMQVNLAAIQGEVSDYKFRKEYYYENAAFLRTWLPTLGEIWGRKIVAQKNVADWKKEQIYHRRSDRLFLKDLSINAYLEKKDGYFEVFAENYHLNQVTIRAYEMKSDVKELVILDEGITLDGYATTADTALFTTFFKPKKIYFTVSNNPDLIVTKKIIPWEKPRGHSARMELAHQFDSHSPYYSVVGQKVVFKGDVVIDKPLLIPDDFAVVINPGTNIEFKTGGGIVASNSFYAQGTADKTIHIFCSDSSSNGITVLNGEEAIFKYVVIEGLSNLHYKNWELTGAVTLYETPTQMSNCIIANNHCEDALNIIRSDFSINELNINNTFSDGFDADFCTGTLNKSVFTRTGNDCIDFSGSTVLITNIMIEESGDKGISGGEASNLSLENITIKGAITGVAAKDGSVVKGNGISVVNAEYGYAAFRKKPEYSGAEIELESTTCVNTGQEVLVELGSAVVLNGIRHEGKEKLDIEALYARFE